MLFDLGRVRADLVLCLPHSGGLASVAARSDPKERPMSGRTFQSLFDRPGNDVFRRWPLMTIGTTLAAAMNQSAIAAAPKNGIHATKNKKKRRKCGRTCQEQVTNCQEAIRLTCSSTENSVACRQRSLPCCDPLATCDATAMLECLLAP